MKFEDGLMRNPQAAMRLERAKVTGSFERRCLVTYAKIHNLTASLAADVDLSALAGADPAEQPNRGSDGEQAPQDWPAAQSLALVPYRGGCRLSGHQPAMAAPSWHGPSLGLGDHMGRAPAWTWLVIAFCMLDQGLVPMIIGITTRFALQQGCTLVATFCTTFAAKISHQLSLFSGHMTKLEDMLFSTLHTMLFGPHDATQFPEPAAAPTQFPQPSAHTGSSYARCFLVPLLVRRIAQ
jgi:hypothetical protein